MEPDFEVCDFDQSLFAAKTIRRLQVWSEIGFAAIAGPNRRPS